MENQRVLIVDDHEPLLRATKRTLGSQAMVLTATEPLEARKLSVEHQPQLAIVDIFLGESSGIDLIGHLKRDRPELIVVAYSAHLTDEIDAAARKAGAAFVEPKSRSVRDVVRLVSAGLEPSPVEQFYQRLFALDETNIEPQLTDALSLLVEITQAQLVYAELFATGPLHRLPIACLVPRTSFSPPAARPRGASWP